MRTENYATKMPSVSRTVCGAVRWCSSIGARANQWFCIAGAKRRLRGRDFTIVSNNCWGAHIYKALARPYTTPFVGIFIPPEDYLQMVSDVCSVVRGDITFISASRHTAVEKFRAERSVNYPIGLLDDRIELHFMHYQSPEEALAKWQRRAGRASWDSESLFFKFCDHDGANEDQVRYFDGMAGLSRVCFTGRKLGGVARTVYMPEYNNGRVPNGGELAKVSGKYFSVVDWIATGGTGGMRPSWGNRL